MNKVPYENMTVRREMTIREIPRPGYGGDFINLRIQKPKRTEGKKGTVKLVENTEETLLVVLKRHPNNIKNIQMFSEKKAMQAAQKATRESIKVKAGATPLVTGEDVGRVALDGDLIYVRPATGDKPHSIVLGRVPQTPKEKGGKKGKAVIGIGHILIENPDPAARVSTPFIHKVDSSVAAEQMVITVDANGIIWVKSLAKLNPTCKSTLTGVQLPAYVYSEAKASKANPHGLKLNEQEEVFVGNPDKLKTINLTKIVNLGKVSTPGPHQGMVKLQVLARK